MSRITGQETAFPVNENGLSGLTIRQELAARAMQGLLANSVITELLKHVPTDSKHASLAETAVLAADALIVELNKTEPEIENRFPPPPAQGDDNRCPF